MEGCGDSVAACMARALRQPFREVLHESRSVLLPYLLFSKPLHGALLLAVWLGLVSSFFGTLLFLLKQHNDFQAGQLPESKAEEKAQAFTTEISAYVESIKMLINTFKFFPTFMILGYMTYSIGRWRTVLHLSMKVIGKLHDIGLHVGGAVIDAHDPRSRRFLFVICEA